VDKVAAKIKISVTF